MRVPLFVATIAAAIAVSAPAAQEGGQQRGQQSQAPLPKELAAKSLPFRSAAEPISALNTREKNGRELSAATSLVPRPCMAPLSTGDIFNEKSM